MKSIPNHSFISIIIVAMTVSYCTAVTCVDGFCFEICLQDEDPIVSCVNREIDFSMATAGSRLYCLDDDTCINITLKCPDEPSTPRCTDPSAQCRHNCEIQGHSGVFQSRHNWTIYAPNSFADLTITDFNLHVDGTMHCGHNYTNSCSMQYGLWNCKDLNSSCFVSDENTEYVDCRGDAQCKGATKWCQDVAEGEPTRTCNVICSGTDSCSNATIHCGLRTQCNVLCTGEKACFGHETQTNIHCPSASQNNYCSVLCGSSTNDNSCHSINIHAVDLRGELRINAMGAKSLKNAQIYGPSWGDVNVQCNGLQSCDEATFFANSSDSIYIGCNYGNASNEGGGACQNIKVYCPTNVAANCVVDGTASDTHTDLQIFALGSWDDVVITDRYKTNAVIDMEGESTMHCGVDSEYDASCLIQNNWFCKCPPLPTVQPSVPPTMTAVPTRSPTPVSDEDGWDRRRNGYVVGGVFVGFVTLCLCVFAIWFCFMRDQDCFVSNDDAYEEVQNGDIEMPGRDQQKREHDDVKEEEEDATPQNKTAAPDHPANEEN